MTEPHDRVLLEDDYLAAAIELKEISQEKKRLAARETAAKTILEKLLTVGEKGVDQHGTELVQIRQGARTFKAAKALELLPRGVLASVSTLQVDTKLAKDVLAPALYDACCEYNKASVIAL